VRKGIATLLAYINRFEEIRASGNLLRNIFKISPGFPDLVAV